MGSLSGYTNINHNERDNTSITTEKIEAVIHMLKPLKIIVEKHSDGYVAYPLGIKGVVIGEGDTYEEALADVKSAIQFHIETFVAEVTV